MLGDSGAIIPTNFKHLRHLLFSPPPPQALPYKNDGGVVYPISLRGIPRDVAKRFTTFRKGYFFAKLYSIFLNKFLLKVRDIKGIIRESCRTLTSGGEKKCRLFVEEIFPRPRAPLIQVLGRMGEFFYYTSCRKSCLHR